MKILHIKKISYLLVFLFTIPLNSHAGDNPALNSHLIGMGGGMATRFSDINGNQTFILFIEHRFPVWWKSLRPWFNIGGSDEDELYIAAGLCLDYFLTDSISIVPSFGGGIYLRSDDSIGLGYPIEFRSAIECNYQFENFSRLGFGIGHISNGGFGKSNPGSEMFFLYYAIPFG